MILTIYIVLCVIWGVFFTGYMFRNWGRLPSLERDISFYTAALILFFVSTVFAPISIWENLPYVIYEIKDK